MLSLSRTAFRAASSASRRMFSSEVKKIGVVGLGLMGHGIAQVSAQAGYQVVAVESSDMALAAGMKRIDGSLSKVFSKEVAAGKITEAAGKEGKEKVMGLIRSTTSLSDAADCDIIVEAIAENMDLKLGFYSKLGGIAKPSAIFASNTSSLQITAMGEASKRPDRFIGLHFFNPVQLMKLVEIIRTDKTSNATYDAVAAYSQKIKKTSVTTPDTPGFIVNRLLVPYMSQAMLLLDNKIATVRDIDVAMQLGAGHPMGPLHLADYVGLDTCLSILSGWKKTFPGEQAFVVPRVLEEKVKAGHFGRKSGKGFYNWNGDKVGEPVV